MKIVVDLIGTHTATGASAIVHTLGTVTLGKNENVPDKARLIQVSGIAGGSVVEIEGSLDQITWKSLFSFTADGMEILDDGVLHIRSNCTTYGSGTITVKAQKFLSDAA